MAHRLLRRLGYDILPVDAITLPDSQYAKLLRANRINLVLDVGANAGQFGLRLRQLGYRGRIVSFEPLQQARISLQAVCSKDPDWLLAERAALGDQHGDIDVHVSANSQSSSVLEMLEAHLKSAPQSRYIDTERVPLRRLDDIASRHLTTGSITLLKIDTQGFEDRVLAGASGILADVMGLHLELSFVPLYANQKLFAEMTAYVSSLGFEMWAIWPALVDPETGRLLQVDATFFRPA
jgi:FkbM family methyltransferase